MPTNIGWKISTFAALGLAVFFAVRSARTHAKGADAPASSASGAAYAVPTGFAFGGEPLTPAAEGSRTARLLGQLGSAKTAAAACDALRELAYANDEPAAQAIIDATDKRRRSAVRLCAIEALGRVNAGAARSWLGELARDRDTQVRDLALLTLAGRADDPEACAIVFAFVRGEDPTLRRAALLALGDAHVAEATPLLVAALGERGGGGDAEILAALGETRDPAALPALTKVAREGVASSRRAALSAAGKIGGPDAIALLEAALMGADRGDMEAAAAALGEMADPAAHRALVTAAADPRRAPFALAALKDAEGDDVRGVMLQRLGAGDPTATAAADYFAAHHDDTAIPSLLALAQGGAPDGASHAIAALVEIGGPAANAAVADLAKRPGPARQAALAQLITTPEGADDARKLCLRMARDDGGRTARMAIEVLAQDETPEGRDALVALAREGNGVIAEQAIATLGQRSDPQTLAFLGDLAEGRGPKGMQVDAVRALGTGGDPRALPALRRALDSKDEDVRLAAMRALGAFGGADAEREILAATGSNDTALRTAAVQALAGRDGVVGAASIARLEQLTKDPDDAVAQTAMQGLVSSAPDRAVKVLGEAIRSPKVERRVEAVQSVQSLEGDVGTPLLVEALRDRDAQVVLAAVGALASIGGADAQRALVDTMTRGSSTPEVAAAAARALETIGGEAARSNAGLIAKYQAAYTPGNGNGEGEGESEGDGEGERPTAALPAPLPASTAAPVQEGETAAP